MSVTAPPAVLHRLQATAHDPTLLPNRQRLHHLLNELAGTTGPSNEPEAPDTPRLLWRAVRNPDRRTITIQAQSPQPFPDNAQRTTMLTNVRTFEYTPEFHTGQQIQFLLDANPRSSTPSSGTRPNGKRKRGAPRPVGTVPDALAWLDRRAGAHGLTLDDVAVTAWQRDTIARGRDRRTGIDVVTYRGTATITDPDLARQAVTTGIGPRKAYGCGMLLAVPS